MPLLLYANDVHGNDLAVENVAGAEKGPRPKGFLHGCSRLFSRLASNVMVYLHFGHWQRTADSALVSPVPALMAVPVPTLNAQACIPIVIPDFSISEDGNVTRQRCSAGERNSATTPMKYASLLTFSSN